MSDQVEVRAPTKEMTVSEDVMIQMIDVHKWYGEFHVLKNIELTVHKGERIVICGPSGSGKSTLIRCINRLEEHQRGQIIVEGTELTGDLKHVEQIRREGRHGFPALQPLSPPDRARKFGIGTDLGAPDAPRRGRNHQHAILGTGEDP